MSAGTSTLAARYVFPVEGPPIAGGLVTIADGRINHVGPIDGRAADLDLGNVAILPGLVNAHTHLELDPIEPSDHCGQDDEIEWLGRVIEQRRRRTIGELKRSVARNLADCHEAGTTLLADVTTGGLSWGPIARAPVRAVVFAELIGLKPMRALQSSQEAFDWLATVRPEAQAAARARPGLSPHAPYSTSGSLYHRAAACRLPLTTHLAELPEELELLGHRRGRLRQFLEDLGAWDDDWEPIGDRPADYIRRGDLRRADWLIAHGNYLEPDDFWQLRPEAAPGDQRVAVAFCPRTHSRFGHGPHPYRAMLQRGVVVCLGTDSRASAPSLSVLDEVRFLHRHDQSLSGPLLLTMATLFGAWALRADDVTGSLRAGKSADLAIVALPDRDADDPHQLLFESDLPVVATAFEGQFITGPWAVA
jgi:cytosine/adenosine deaminase-related metal-dependent hydrolase